MSTRIDSARETLETIAPAATIDGAQSVLDELAVTDESKTNLPAEWCGATADEQWMVMATITEAQARATLALAREQRAANIIALAIMDRVTVRDIVIP